MRKQDTVRAVIVKRDGGYHWLTRDANEQQRWIMVGRFARGVSRKPGAIVTLRWDQDAACWRAIRNAGRPTFGKVRLSF